MSDRAEIRECAERITKLEKEVVELTEDMGHLLSILMPNTHRPHACNGKDDCELCKIRKKYKKKYNGKLNVKDNTRNETVIL